MWRRNQHINNGNHEKPEASYRLSMAKASKIMASMKKNIGVNRKLIEIARKLASMAKAIISI
jgi:hypothetical protein